MSMATGPLYDTDLIERAKTDRAAMDDLLAGCRLFIWHEIWQTTSRESIFQWGLDPEDVWQECAIRFIAAVRSWDPARGSFAALAATAVRREVLLLHKRLSGKPPRLSLDAELYGGEDGSPSSLMAYLPVADDLPTGDMDTIRRCLGRLRGRRAVIVAAALRHRLSGSTLQGAATELGISRSYVDNRYLAFCRDLKRRVSA